LVLAELVETSRALAETSGRLDKIARLASLLERLAGDEVEIAVAFLSGSPRQGRIGVAGAAVAAARSVPPAAAATLGLKDVDASFARMATMSGPGTATARAEALRDLARRATAHEQDFLVRLLFGELRQGALEGVLAEAIARAAGVPADRVRRAAMFAGGLSAVAMAALVERDTDLSRFTIRLFHPIQPMLADSAADVDEALSELGEASLEYKVDGARIQVHKGGDEVRVFTRNLKDVTARVPEIVETVRSLPAREVVLDGEAVALGRGQRPEPFQVTMRRFGRKLEVERLRHDVPISPFFFDCVYLDGHALIDEPYARRARSLAGLTPPEALVSRLVTSDPVQAEAYFDRAVQAGFEGVMAKAVNGLYAAGRRGHAWLKVKRARTLDLVILAAEWGHGRRRGTLSNLHLGARDDAGGGFVMLGKTFKGLTDEMLSWQTKKLLELEISRDAYTVYVRPELVVEVAFNDIQESPTYPGGLALRFARVKRYRLDKTATAADTFSTVRDIHRLSLA
jgi:ATP-dependent DNA ligase I